MNSSIELSPELSVLIERFTVKAQGLGWDTFEGSTGMCWFIANAFSLDAHAFGYPVEMWRVENIHSTRSADDVSNFVVVDGLAVDFASHGGANSTHKPWPWICPVEEYLAAYGGERGLLCPTCGTRDAVHSDGVCPGPLEADTHKAIAKETFTRELADSGLLSLLMEGLK